MLGLVEVNLDEPIVLYRVTTLDNFFGDILSHLGFLFNFSDSINEQIAGAGSGGSGKSAVTDIGGILTSYEAGQTESGMPQWSFGLGLSSLTDGGARFFNAFTLCGRGECPAGHELYGHDAGHERDLVETYRGPRLQ